MRNAVCGETYLFRHIRALARPMAALAATTETASSCCGPVGFPSSCAYVHARMEYMIERALGSTNGYVETGY